MSFLGSIVHGITHAVGQVVNVVKKAVKNPIVDAVAGAALAATGLGAPIAGAIVAGAKKATSVLENVGGSVLSTIAGPVGDAIRAVQGVIGPIATVVNNIATEVRDINEHVIQPIVGPITATIAESRALLDGLKADLHGGITGLLRIPQTISDALTSEAAVFTRAVSQLGDHNAQVASTILAPAIHDAAAGPLGKVTDAITGLSSAPEPAAPFLHEVDITEPSLAKPLSELTASLYKTMETQGGIVGWIISRFMDLASWLPFLEAYLEPQAEVYKSEAWKSLPTKPLDPATVVAAMLRGVTSPDSGAEELARNGLDESRQAILTEMSHPLPGVGDLNTMRDRDEITADQYLDIMRRLGYDETDAQRLWRVSHTVTGMGEAIRYASRLAAKQRGLAATTLDSLPPDAVVAAVQNAGVDVDALAAAWTNHWNTLPYSVWIDAYFRRLVTWDDVTAVLTDNAVPSELHELVRDTTRPLIQFRSIPGLVAAGIWDKATGLDKLKQHGYSDTDAEALLEYALKKAKPAATAAAPGLHALSQQEALAAYENGIITRDEASQLLAAHNLDARAVEVTLSLADLKEQRIARTTLVNDVVAQVENGTLTSDAASQQLTQAGLSVGEVAKAMQRISSARRKTVKLPGVAEIQSMFKKAIIDEATAGSTLSALGYADEWVSRFLQLWGATDLTTPTPAT